MSTDRRLYRLIAAGDRTTMRILDATTNAQAEFLCGGDSRIESFFYIGPDNNRSSMDISGIATITLYIKELGPGNEPPTPDDPAIVAINTAQINPCTWSEWQQGAQGHAVFEVSEEKFSLAPGTYWLAFWAVANNGNVFAINAGRVTFKQDGVGTNTTVTPPDPGAIDWSMIRGIPSTFAAGTDGGISLYKTSSGKWVSITATGPAGGPTTLSISQEYDSPDAIPPSETPLAQTITLVSGTSFNVGDGFVVSASGDISWLTVNSVVGIDGKGRAIVLSKAGSNITLQVTEANFSAPVVTGDVMRAIQLAGPQGEAGKDGDTVAEDRLEVLETTSRQLGGAVSPGLDGDYGYSGYAYRQPVTLDGDKTFLFKLKGGSYFSGQYFYRAVFLGGQNFAVFARNAPGEVGLFFTKEVDSPVQIAPVYIHADETWPIAIRFYLATNQVQAVINGVEYPAVTIPWSITGTVQRFLSAHYVGYGEFAGWCGEHAVYNRILSVEEIEDYFKYGVSAKDHWGIKNAQPWVNNATGSGEAWNLAFSSGDKGQSLSCSTGAGSYSFAGVPIKTRPGQKLRVKMSCTEFTPNPVGSAPFFMTQGNTAGTWEIISGNNVQSNGAGFLELKGTGDFEAIFTASVEYDWLIFRTYESGGTFSLENIEVGILGAEANFTQDSVSPKGAWMDGSEVSNDANRGATSLFAPLSPHTQQRTIAVTVSAITATNSIANVTLTATGADANALAAVRSGDPVELRFGNTGRPAGVLAVDCYSPSNGSVVASLYTATPTQSIAAFTATLVHTIR